METILALGFAICFLALLIQSYILIFTVKDLLVLGELLNTIVNNSSQGQDSDLT